ncbi:aldose 1-epimerase [Larsenimonas suaedae]|uniref:Aldose 1-epimerase n=1 Tax=Larsenimonas suaedae TaxID=1851019 RepID=A0ABU1GWD8_9GAMM|nr:aldose 1-epimerase [Larsenimonas suaedae]MCM2973426.1 aldose 1-epimerase [Larsenimonas suaedae]MDR5896319.1 aldose 1-epimerase [Larsenimonas suaedae]
MGFVVVCDSVEGAPCTDVFDGHGQLRLRQSSLGATVMSLALATPEGDVVEVIDGYRNGDELFAGDGARSAVLAPFSNRVANGQYTWHETTYQLPTNGGDHALHGVAHTLSWRLVNHHATHDVAELSFEATITPDSLEGYPFNLTLELDMVLTDSELTWSFKAVNKSEFEAPVGLGWHPYFLPPGGDLSVCRITLPPSHAVNTDDTLIPLEGEQALEPSKTTSLTLGDDALDCCFVPDDSATSPTFTTRLEAPGAPYAVVVEQSGGVVQIFTGEGLATRPRQSVAIEPNEFMPDAFNREAYQESLALSENAMRTFTAKVRLERSTLT